MNTHTTDHTPHTNAPDTTLAHFFGVEKIKFALVIIDVQKEFCDPDYIGPYAMQSLGSAHTKSVAKDIAKITPKFRALAIPVYVIHLDEQNQGFDNALGGAYKLAVEPQDRKITKTGTSAFKTSDLEQRLKADGHTHLLAMGFNSSDCFFETVSDALARQFNVAMLDDGIGEDKGCHGEIGYNLHALQSLGAARTNSKTALEHLLNMA